MEREKMLQVRMSSEELDTAKKLATIYGVDMSTFIRTLITNANDTRPSLRITPVETDNGKGQVSKHQSSD